MAGRIGEFVKLQDWMRKHENFCDFICRFGALVLHRQNRGSIGLFGAAPLLALMAWAPNRVQHCSFIMFYYVLSIWFPVTQGAQDFFHCLLFSQWSSWRQANSFPLIHFHSSQLTSRMSTSRTWLPENPTVNRRDWIDDRNLRSVHLHRSLPWWRAGSHDRGNELAMLKSCSSCSKVEILA